MKLGYNIIKLWLRTGLFFFYTKIRVVGKGNIPRDKPIMLLANHQNALMDALIIVMKCGLRPYFLARSDLFKKPLVSKFLHYLQMIPIYRFRDGIDTLKNNPAIFKKCGDLLLQGETVMLFPEGNHGIQRRVRWPMKKGFVKMIYSALERDPDLDIQILPVGLNYIQAADFPDSVSLYIGKAFAVQDYYDSDDLQGTEKRLKDEVYKRLKTLTTHISDEETYDNVLSQLNNKDVDYLKPDKVNRIIAELDPAIQLNTAGKNKNWILASMRIFFTIINFPVLLLWYNKVKSIQLDIEFRTSLRFMFGLVLFPIYFLLLYLIIGYTLGQDIAIAMVLAHILFNLLFVKLR